MCDEAFSRTEPPLPSLETLSISPPNVHTLPPELIVVHVLPYLTNGEKDALAKTCGRLFRLLRHERVYRLSSQCTRRYLEDAAFRDEVDSRIPAGKLVLRPFECALRALHFAPFEFKRARTLFKEVLADESATELEKARAHLSLYMLHWYSWGGPHDWWSVNWHRASADGGASLLLCAADLNDPVRALEMGICLHRGVGTKLDRRGAHALYVSSAKGGCAAGMAILGHCLFYGDGESRGDGVSRDESAAVAHYERAAAMGHFGAMYWFGECLFQGRGVPCDAARGVALIRRSAVDEGSWKAKDWLELYEEALKRKGL